MARAAATRSPHAYELLKVQDPRKRRSLAEQVASGELSLVKLRERIEPTPPAAPGIAAQPGGSLDALTSDPAISEGREVGAVQEATGAAPATDDLSGGAPIQGLEPERFGIFVEPDPWTTDEDASNPEGAVQRGTRRHTHRGRGLDRRGAR